MQAVAEGDCLQCLLCRDEMPLLKCKESKSTPHKAKRCYSFCAYCGMCINHCKEFEEVRCDRHNKPPYCCNGCSKTRTCLLQKKY